MKWQWSLLPLLVLSTTASAQDSVPGSIRSSSKLPFTTSAPADDPMPADTGENHFADTGWEDGHRRFLTSDRAFPGFIGWISNPEFNIDPRSLTQIMPLYLGVWTDQFKILPEGNAQIMGPGLSLGLTDRLSIGLNRGGWAVANFGRQREGWLDIGGYAQYTLIRDVPDQFLFAAGIQFATPSGAKQLFQGSPPDDMAVYGTLGKEFCRDFHVLLTAGYQFPLGSGKVTEELFYGNLHLDARMFGWLYPLVEFNSAYHTTTVNLSKTFPRDFIDLGSFSGQGNILVVAPGINAVLIHDRLEIGGVYSTPIVSQHNFNFNSVLVKMVVRF
jgi:hypothetical protein